MNVQKENVIIAGVDGSSPSTAAALWAAAEATRRRTSLRLVHAYLFPTVGYPGAAVLASELGVLAHAKGMTILDTARDAVLERYPQLEVTTRMRNDSPVDLLHADSERALLTVLGSHGRHQVIEALLGSVAARMAGHAHSPVVVVRSDSSNAMMDESGPIVVGLDGTPSCEDALAFAFEEASMWGKRLVAVHSWDETVLDGFLRSYPLDINRNEIDEYEHRMLAEQLAGWAEKYPDVTVQQLVLRGKTTTDLLNPEVAVRGPRPALIVVGTRSGGRFTSLLRGSTSHALLAGAPCPVAVVPSSAH